MNPGARGLLAGAVCAALLSGCGALDTSTSTATVDPAGGAAGVSGSGEGPGASLSAGPSRHEGRAEPLAGRLVVIDPGHQLGNHNFPDQIDRPVPAGGFTKACNTTGTATDAGYPEATFAWRVATRLARLLRHRGARVLLTRHSNSEHRWGPCVDVRGRAGNAQHADLKISIHGDGSYTAGAHGFHVIAPTDRAPWTHDIYRSSRRLGLDLRRSLHRSGLAFANYAGAGTGMDFRSDLATLNLSDIPTVLVELGNMRDAADARTMTSAAGQAAYARALERGASRFLARRR